MGGFDIRSLPVLRVNLCHITIERKRMPLALLIHKDIVGVSKQNGFIGKGWHKLFEEIWFTEVIALGDPNKISCS